MMLVATRFSFFRSRLLRLFAALLILVAAGGGAELSAASQTRPVDSRLSVLLAPTPDLSADPIQAGTNCLKRDDAACAVLVWEHQFTLKPYDDQTRQSLVAALLLDCFRSLDKADLSEARAALKRAKELIPASPNYQYYQDALDAYQSVLYQDDMANKTKFTLENTPSLESRYADIAGVFGGQTSVFALTEKSPGMFESYRLWGISTSASPKNEALRFEVFPLKRVRIGICPIRPARRFKLLCRAIVLVWRLINSSGNLSTPIVRLDEHR
jgi:hypothetical protein